MRYETDRMRSILKNEKAREMIDTINSRLYSESYAGLWIFQAIGTVMEEVYRIADGLRFETNPATADLLLDYWEDHYGIPRDSGLTKEQRQNRIIAQRQTRGPCNPTVLANAVSVALGGVPVEITENVAKNTFLVNIQEVIDDITPAVAVLERRKPAHLIYQLRIATKTVSTAQLKTAIAMTYAEQYNKVEVQQ